MTKAQNKIHHSDLWSLAKRSDDQRIQQYQNEVAVQKAIVDAKHAIIVAKETIIEMLQQRIQNLNDEYHNKYYGRKATTSADVDKLEKASDS